MKIGVITDCFKTDTETAIRKAAALGLSGVQIYATKGAFSPWTLTSEQKDFYKKLLSDCGLVVSALCGDMGGYGFQKESDNAERVEKTKAIVDLAVEFGAKVVTTHIGVIPSDPANPRYGVMLRALTECGKYAMSKGVTLAIETGPEDAKTLLGFVSATKGGVGVNLDPANFTMVTRQDAVEAVYMLKDYIVHTHLKDGKNLVPVPAAEVYGEYVEGQPPAKGVRGTYLETPLGEGDVDFENYVKALKEIGYDGFLTIERECGDDPEKDIVKAVEFIKKYL